MGNSEFIVWKESPHGERKGGPLPSRQMRRNPRESLVKFREGYMEPQTGISQLSMRVSEAADLLICLSAYFRRENASWGDE